MALEWSSRFVLVREELTVAGETSEDGTCRWLDAGPDQGVGTSTCFGRPSVSIALVKVVDGHGVQSMQSGVRCDKSEEEAR